MPAALFRDFSQTERLAGCGKNGVGAVDANIACGVDAVEKRIVAVGFGVKNAQITRFFKALSEKERREEEKEQGAAPEGQTAEGGRERIDAKLREEERTAGALKLTFGWIRKKRKDL